jgi:hypothetical protein
MEWKGNFLKKRKLVDHLECLKGDSSVKLKRMLEPSDKMLDSYTLLNTYIFPSVCASVYVWVSYDSKPKITPMHNIN